MAKPIKGNQAYAAPMAELIRIRNEGRMAVEKMRQAARESEMLADKEARESRERYREQQLQERREARESRERLAAIKMESSKQASQRADAIYAQIQTAKIELAQQKAAEKNKPSPPPESQTYHPVILICILPELLHPTDRTAPVGQYEAFPCNGYWMENQQSRALNELVKAKLKLNPVGNGNNCNVGNPADGPTGWAAKLRAQGRQLWVNMAHKYSPYITHEQYIAQGGYYGKAPTGEQIVCEEQWRMHNPGMPEWDKPHTPEQQGLGVLPTMETWRLV